MLRDWLSIDGPTAVPKNRDFRGAFEERERERVWGLNFNYHPLTRCSKRLVRSGKKPAKLAKPGPFRSHPPRPVFLGCLFGVWSGRNVRGIAWRMECVCFWLGTGNCLLWGLRVCVRCTRLRFSTDTLLLCVARCAGGTSELEAIAPKFY